ncbi:helix-turn-helix domain-containing protein [Methylogaea oryzae]|nr:helix-turn-helix transcriptional regulator [Methylogaea oryzae]
MANALSRAGDQPELSPRQRQILELLKAGKVNKEIANELGIGLGTVKQHVVALFKKLHVRNRTMAVSQGLNLAAEAPTERPPVIDGLLERRPCVVLSLGLPGNASPDAVGLLHKTLSAFAFEHDALFLARKDNAGDLIFGLQRATEQDVYKALRAAGTAFDALAECAEARAGLRGGLTAGLAIASMHRRGGWSGEAVASSVIAQSRDLADGAAPGRIVLGAAAENLLRVLGPGATGFTLSALSFEAVERLPWPAGGGEPPLAGRDEELACLEDLLAEAAQGHGRLVYIEGETGMGKSRLCRHVAERCRSLGGEAQHFVCQPESRLSGLYRFPDGIPCGPQTLSRSLAAAPRRPPSAVIVDDGHLLAADALARLTEQAARAQGKLVVVTARKFPKSAARPSAQFKLGRLPLEAMEALVAQLPCSQDADQAASVARQAAGVPLFAVELARHRGEGALPLALRVVIGARMDSLGLDRVLLRQLARAATPCGEAEIAAALRETPEALRYAIEQAAAGGVLSRDEQGGLSFAHPLLRLAVEQSGVE